MVKTRNANAELDTLPSSVKDDLLKFNLTKKRIVDLVNEVFEDDPLEGVKAYSSFHRALDGFETYKAIVDELTGLRDSQIARPSDFLPDEGPREDLVAWMSQIGKATFWYDVLDLDMTQSTLNAWFSGRGKRERPDVREQVEAWWDRLQEAVGIAERVSMAETRDRYEVGNHLYDRDLRAIETWDTFCKDLDCSVEDMREPLAQELGFMWANTPQMIDLNNPSFDVQPFEPDYHYADRLLARLVERDFCYAVSKEVPNIPEPEMREAQWPDRRSEEGPVDVNRELYRLHYREVTTYFWNARARRVDHTREVVAVSDGQEWREPTEREREGWNSGFDDYIRALDAFKSTDNEYTREVDRAEQALRAAQNALEDEGWDERKVDGLEEKVAERDAELRRAINDY
ncbi:MAG: hypothetical protein QNI90_09530 [Dinoroseobacter sp.]|nr:hypothetical protein [Dinoroseobacter sp.]